MAKITFDNKVAIVEYPEIPEINKMTDANINEIKSVVNSNDDNTGTLSNLNTSTKTNVVAAVNEVNNNIGTLSNLTTTTKTSAVAAINELDSDKAADDIILVQSTEPSSDTNILWINDGQIGTPASEITNSYSESTGIGYSANYINNLHTYSTDEIRIGTWLGKPLYRKVIEIPLTSISSQNATVINILNNATIIPRKINGMIGFTTSNTYYPLTGSANRTATGYQIRWQNSTNIQIVIDTSQSAEVSVKGGYVIIEYTKTTD